MRTDLEQEQTAKALAFASMFTVLPLHDRLTREEGTDERSLFSQVGSGPSSLPFIKIICQLLARSVGEPAEGSLSSLGSFGPKSPNPHVNYLVALAGRGELTLAPPASVSECPSETHFKNT